MYGVSQRAFLPYVVLLRLVALFALRGSALGVAGVEEESNTLGGGWGVGRSVALRCYAPRSGLRFARRKTTTKGIGRCVCVGGGGAQTVTSWGLICHIFVYIYLPLNLMICS